MFDTGWKFLIFGTDFVLTNSVEMSPREAANWSVTQELSNVMEPEATDFILLN
jgi:hypothetical protein